MSRMKGIGLVLVIFMLVGRVNTLPAEAAAKASGELPKFILK